jgi:hypothetical protein
MSWRDYILSSDDLWCSGITTKESAITHYNVHGKREHRPFNNYFPLHVAVASLTVSTPRRRLVAELNNPGFFCGLFNQLDTLCTLLVLGHIVNADIVVRGFYPQFQRYDLPIPLSEVINLVATNNLLMVLGLRSRLFDYQSENYTAKVVEDRKTLLAFAMEFDSTGDNLDLGPMYREEVTNPGSPEADRLYSFLLSKLRFTDVFYNVTNQVKNLIELKGNYSAVHLRLEPDTRIYAENAKTDYDRFLTVHTDKYRSIFQALRNDKVFVATGLDQESLSAWRKNFHNLCWKPADWRDKVTALPVGREIDAIIDYLICIQAKYFAGWGRSTFALNVNHYFSMVGRKCEIFASGLGIEDV